MATPTTPTTVPDPAAQIAAARANSTSQQVLDRLDHIILVLERNEQLLRQLANRGTPTGKR
jgi:hypothetical protein